MKIEAVAPAVEVLVSEPVAERVTEIRKVVESAAAVMDEVEIPVAETESGQIAPAAPSGGFHDLNLREEVRQAVVKSGYATPTPIQTEIIPLMLAGSRLAGSIGNRFGQNCSFRPADPFPDRRREPQNTGPGSGADS